MTEWGSDEGTLHRPSGKKPHREGNVRARFHAKLPRFFRLMGSANLICRMSALSLSRSWCSELWGNLQRKMQPVAASKPTIRALAAPIDGSGAFLLMGKKKR